MLIHPWIVAHCGHWAGSNGGGAANDAGNDVDVDSDYSEEGDDAVDHLMNSYRGTHYKSTSFNRGRVQGVGLCTLTPPDPS
jgi:hypothetical protein